MRTLKCTIDLGCHGAGQTQTGRLRKMSDEICQIAPVRGQPFCSDRVCALCEHKAETKRRRPFHPRTPNAQEMVAGIAVRTIKNGGLELFAKSACED